MTNFKSRKKRQHLGGISSDSSSMTTSYLCGFGRAVFCGATFRDDFGKCFAFLKSVSELKFATCGNQI